MIALSGYDIPGGPRYHPLLGDVNLKYVGASSAIGNYTLSDATVLSQHYNRSNRARARALAETNVLDAELLAELWKAACFRGRGVSAKQLGSRTSDLYTDDDLPFPN